MDDNQLYHGLGRVEGKIDLLLSNQARTDKRLDEQDARIAAIETALATGKGVARTVSRMAGWHWALIAAALGIFGDNIKDWIIR